MSTDNYDVVIVGAGVAGAILAKQLGQAGKRVLVLEAGPAAPASRSGFMSRYFTNTLKSPSSPYPPAISPRLPDEDFPLPDRLATPRATIPMLFTPGKPGSGYVTDPESSYLVQRGPAPFCSTYERVSGGTTWHWLGTVLRLLPDDFQLKSKFGVGRDWPIGYDRLLDYYAKGEAEIGVSADAAAQPFRQEQFPPGGYQFPMPGIPDTMVDQAIAGADGLTIKEQYGGQDFDLNLRVTPTPQGRNSRQYGERRQCQGNTNCIPICPIAAKYDATTTMKDALQTGKVTVMAQTVATKVNVDKDNGRISGIDYITWTKEIDPQTGDLKKGTASGTLYVLAAHAIETPRLLLMSATNEVPRGVGNSSDMVGRNLMDHTMYLSWALSAPGKPVFPFRGPLATSGIETTRQGEFRRYRAAYRIEIGNEGWNWATGDPTTTFNALLTGERDPAINPEGKTYFGPELVARLNDIYSRQLRLGFLIEQPANPSNRVKLSSDFKDGLGLPRPETHYRIDDYTARGFQSAKAVASEIYRTIGATEYTHTKDITNSFEFQGEKFNFYGAGHILGTTIMGPKSGDSVVDGDLKSWDHDNLFICGTNVFPAEGAANPTNTLAALSFRLADHLVRTLG